MSTVDEAVEAGARAMHADMCCPLDPDSQCDEADLPGDEAHLAIRAAWPVLSAGLRGLVADWQANGNTSDCCEADAWHKAARQLLTELDRIDRELGIGPERAAPCTDHRPVQHRDARPPWCNTCGLTADGAIPTGPLDRHQSGESS